MNRFALVPFALALGAGCIDELPSYNEVEGFRVLALGADDPWLQPRTTTTLSALVASDTSTASATFAWSWCPFTSGSAGGYECVVTRDELQAQIDAQDPPVPIEVPPFELGTTSTVAFEYPFPELVVQAFCEQIGMVEVPEFVEIPACDNRLAVTVQLVAENDGQRITAVKEIDLLFGSDAPQNSNPRATALFARRGGVGEEVPILEDGTTELVRGQDYELVLAIDEAQSEAFERTNPETMMLEPRREALTFTWFVTAGETDRGRTGFIDGEVSLDDARRNLWSVPRALDFEGDTARVFVVVRDGRKGTTWIQRTVRLRG